MFIILSNTAQILYKITVVILFMIFFSLNVYSDVSLNKESQSYIQTVKTGFVQFDYQVIPLPENRNIDLMGLHYLHQVYPFTYLGAGIHAPLFYGNYGGFMAFDFTLHFQKKMVNNLFLNGGVSFGGGAGGSDINQVIELSGKGRFIKQYVGVGYALKGVTYGLNYSYFKFFNSLIDHSHINVFVQKPISFSTGLFDYSGNSVTDNQVKYDKPYSRQSTHTFGVALNTMDQINPTGVFQDNINVVSLQFSYYPLNDYYFFLQGDCGYHGLPTYNQALVGVGYRHSFSSRLNLRSQLGIGSGGYSPTEVDTASGLLISPNLSLEYLLNPKLGILLNTGYLLAPRGSAKMTSFGFGFNYHPSGTQIRETSNKGDEQLYYRGYHLNISHQLNYDVMHKKLSDNKVAISDLNLLSIKTDYFFNDHWFLPLQLNMAVNDILGYPGYGELLSGIGIKSDIYNRFQFFSQVLIGANTYGLILKPELGVHYYLTNQLSFFAQIGQLISINSLLDSSENLFKTNTLNASTVGFGLTYHFSFLEIPGSD